MEADPLFLAGVVGVATLVCAKRALAVVQVPQATIIGYALAPGAATVISPPANVPIFLMGNCTTVDVRGVGHATIHRVLAPDLVQWVGLNSNSLGTISHGFTSVAGTKIINIDFPNQVLVETNGPTRIRIRNTAPAVRSGSVRLLF
jgi:hypothetical protein